MRLRLTPAITVLTGLGLLLPLHAGAALPPGAPDSGRLTRELQAPLEMPREETTIALSALDAVIARASVGGRS